MDADRVAGTGRDRTEAAGVATTPSRAGRAAEEPGSASMRPAGPGSMAGGVAGREFRAAVESSTGHSLPGSGAKLPESMRSLPQAQRVRRLARELNALFNEWDTGRIALDVFREELRAYGIEETMEAQRALRGPGQCTFSHLFRALCTPDDPAALHSAAGVRSRSRPATAAVAQTIGQGMAVMAPPVASGGAMGTSSGGGSSSLDIFGRGPVPQRLSGKKIVADARAAATGRDVVTWRGDFAGASGRASAWSTARMGNVDNHGLTTGREDKDHMAETGAGAVLRGEEVPEGVTADTLAAARSSVARPRTAAGRIGQRSRGVAGALHDSVADIDAPSRFESAASSSARRGLGGAVASSGPLSSAGYDSSAGALIRQQLYSLVRQLDAGAVSVGGFRDRMASLGVGVPAPVEKLLADFSANGKADFAKFVRAFDSVIASLPASRSDSRAASAAHSVASPGRGEPSYEDEDGQAHVRGRRHASGKAVRGHGDIVSWEGATLTPEEVADSMRKEGLRPRLQRDRNLYDGRSAGRDIVAWSAEQDPAASAAQQAAHGPSRRARGPQHIASRNAGDFITWSAEPSGAPVGSARGAGVTGDASYSGHRGAAISRALEVMPDGTLVGGGVRMVDTPLAQRSGVRDPPFGTVRDELPHDPHQGARILSPTAQRSAEWTSYSADDPYA